MAVSKCAGACVRMSVDASVSETDLKEGERLIY